MKLRDLERTLAAHASLSGVRTYNAPKVRFSATVGEEPEVEVGTG